MGRVDVDDGDSSGQQAGGWSMEPGHGHGAWAWSMHGTGMGDVRDGSDRALPAETV